MKSSDKQKYLCSECNYSRITHLDFVPKYCNYTHEVPVEGLKQGLISYKSLQKVSETVRNVYGCEPTKQTIINHISRKKEEYLSIMEKEIDEKFENRNIGFNGVYNYDEQL